MTTKEHVHRLIDELTDDEASALEEELIIRLERERGPLPWMPEHYNPLGSVRNLVSATDYDGPTDVSVDKYRYVADSIDPE